MAQSDPLGLQTFSERVAKTHGDLEAQEREHLKKNVSIWVTLGLAYSACGVIYGDIGTSPLYTYASIFTSTPSEVQILGATSLIFWSITLVVILKYITIVLCADDHGEGGTFALYSLLCRHADILPGMTGSRDEGDHSLSRYSSFREASDAPRKRSPLGATLRGWLQGSQRAQTALLILVLCMTSLVLGDGVLTPAQSVLGAVYGLQYKASVSQGAVVGIACAIVIILFMLQRFGTGRVGFSFAPIVLLWFSGNIIMAGYNIATWYPGVFKALSPHYIYHYFKETKHEGWVSLAGIFLAITGTEATYADLGHFSKNAIRIGFLGVAYPALTMTYFGQAAWLLKHPDQYGSTFFASIPVAWGNGFYWPMLIVSLLAACVASQAMISGAFSIIKQSIALGCFPRVTVKHKSKLIWGQVYIPEVSYVMMILTVVVIAIFKTTTQLGQAYGVAVNSMMVGTTFLVYLVMLMVWELNFFLATAFFVIYMFIDCTFLSANLNKVPTGGWFALAIAGGVTLVSCLWQWGRMQKETYLKKQKSKVEDLLASTPGALALLNAKTGEVVARPAGLALLYSEHMKGAPPLLPALINRWGALHHATVITTIRNVAVPRVEVEERFVFQKLNLPGVYRCVARYGYLDTVDQGQEFIDQIEKQVAYADPPAASQLPPPEAAIYIFSRIEVEAHKKSNPVRRFLLEGVYNTLQQFSRRTRQEWMVPTSNLFEVGLTCQV